MLKILLLTIALLPACSPKQEQEIQDSEAIVKDVVKLAQDVKSS